MLHIPLMTLPGRIKGLSPIAQAAEQIGMTLSSQEHAARFLGDGVHMSGTIETPEPLEKEDAEDLWEGFQKVHAGPSKAGRVGILTGGAKFNTITIPPAELQFLEQMKYGDRKIATLYGVPPHMVGDVERSTSWGTGIEEQTQGFVQYTLLPIIKKVEQGVESAFLRGTDLQMRFEVKGLLRGSVKDRIELHKALYSMGAASANTILASEDMPPIAGDEGDRRYVPLNLRPADQVIPLKDRVDAAGALVRAGFDPADALGAVGLEAMQHSGAPPVTVQVSPSPADDEEGA